MKRLNCIPGITNVLQIPFQTGHDGPGMPKVPGSFILFQLELSSFIWLCVTANKEDVFD